MDLPKDVNLSQLKAEKCRRSFYYFFKEYWDVIVPEDLVDNWHIEYICDEMQKVGEKIIAREPKDYDLIINISAGSTKSSIVSVMFPAWLWANDPSLRTISGSHASGLALDLAVKSRDIVKSEKYQNMFPDVTIKADADNKSHYQTTEGGARIATSVGGGVIGQHAHAIIVDDPCDSNPTDNELRSANKWVTNDLATRKVEKKNTPTILIMQRLAENDPTAHLLKKSKNVKHICIPAELGQGVEVKPSHLKEHYVDGLMDTERLDRDVLKDMKEDLGSFQYTTQFLQSPQPAEGGIIKKDWVGGTVMTDDMAEKLSDVPTNFYLDTAYTEDVENNDPSALLACKKIGNLLYVTYVTEVWKEFNEFVSWLPDILSEYGYTSRSKIYIEPKASGKSITSYLQKQTKYNVIEDDSPSESKEARLRAVSPKIEAQKVVFIAGSWNESYFEQLCNPKPIHDDMRDVTIMAIRNELVEGSKDGEYHYR